MERFINWIRRFIGELRRRRVIRVAVVYAGTAFVILQLAEILVDPFGLGSWTLRLITLLLILGFPLAVGLAWVYNITEEGVVRDVGREAALEGSSGSSPFTSNGLIVGLLMVAIGLLLYPQVFSSGGPARKTAPSSQADTAEAPERSVAVLPFANLSGTEKARPLVRGLHDDLLTRLSNVSGLKVISRTSVERYRNTDLSLPAIADSLGAKWIIEGGVQQASGKIQVNAQLIDPRSDVHRWADSYRRDLTAEDLFAIQGEIAGEIAGALEAKLTAGEQERIAGAPTDDLEAYRLYVQGRRLLDTRRADSIRQARHYFEQALAKDSTYALAWAGLADALALFPQYNHPDSPAVMYEALMGALPEAKEAARRAVELDSDLAEAHTSLAYVHLLGLEGPAALTELRRAVELRPSYAQAQDWLGGLLLSLGRPEAALRHLQLAVELNPEHQNALAWLNSALMANGRYEEALALARRRRDLGAETRALLHLRRWPEARSVAREALDSGKGDRWVKAHLALANVATGDTASARRRLEELSGGSGLVIPLPVGLVHAALGDHDAAIAALGRIFEEGDLPPPHLGHLEYFRLRYDYPDVLGSLRDDSRYEELLQKANQAWGLKPDGSLPEESESPSDERTASARPERPYSGGPEGEAR